MLAHADLCKGCERCIAAAPKVIRGQVELHAAKASAYVYAVLYRGKLLYERWIAVYHAKGRTATADVASVLLQQIKLQKVNALGTREFPCLLEAYVKLSREAEHEKLIGLVDHDDGLEHLLKVQPCSVGDMHGIKVLFVNLVGDDIVLDPVSVKNAHCIRLCDFVLHALMIAPCKARDKDIGLG